MLKDISLASIIIIFFSSCSKNEKEVNDINSFLKLNYEFNFSTLNENKIQYLIKIEEDPQKAVEGLSKLEEDYKKLIIEIDNFKNKKNASLDSINSKYHTFFKNIRKIVKKDKRNIINNGLINFETTSDNTELKLNIMKNNLAIAFSNVYKYACYYRWAIACGIRTFDHIDTKVTTDKNNNIKIILLSDFAQLNDKNRQIVVNKITLNGSKKDINYDIVKNYSFADIDVKTPQKGLYELYGTINFFDIDRTYEIPFKQKFEIK